LTYGIDLSTLRRRFVVLAADGAGVRGGQDARSNSTGAGEILWAIVFKQVLEQGARAEWGAFHLLGICTRRAIAAVPAAIEVFGLCKIMSALLGTGDGRAALRRPADLVGVQSCTVPDQGGVLKIVTLSHSVRSLSTLVLRHGSGWSVSAACRRSGERWSQVEIPELCDLCTIPV
jgi:hypothetical protein